MALLEINEEKKQLYKDELMDAIKRYKFMRLEHIQWDALSFSRSTAYNGSEVAVMFFCGL